MNAASNIGRKVQQHAHFFSQSQAPRAQVALLVNEDLYHFFQACNGDVQHHYMYNMRGWVRRACGVSASPSTLSMPPTSEPVNWSNTMRLCCVCRWRWRRTGSPIWSGDVDRGGFLISEACPGRYDRLGWTTRAQMVGRGRSPVRRFS